jgi:hypothetical protein
MNPEDTEHPAWVDAARAGLDSDVQAYDAALLSRLNQARQRALDRGLAKPARLWPWQWPALAFASALGLMLALGMPLRSPENAGSPAAIAPATDPDFEMLVAGEDLELIENLEFYAWLDQQSLGG